MDTNKYDNNTCLYDVTRGELIVSKTKKYNTLKAVVKDVDTSSFSDGAKLCLSTTGIGAFTEDTFDLTEFIIGFSKELTALFLERGAGIKTVIYNLLLIERDLIRGLKPDEKTKYKKLMAITEKLKASIDIANDFLCNKSSVSLCNSLVIFLLTKRRDLCVKKGPVEALILSVFLYTSVAFDDLVVRKIAIDNELTDIKNIHFELGEHIKNGEGVSCEH